MNSRVIITLATVMLVATIGITTTTTLAENPKDATPPNTWGKAASGADPGEMGEHASSFAGQPRLGIGNVAKDLVPGGNHPSDIPAFLCSLDPSNALCN